MKHSVSKLEQSYIIGKHLKQYKTISPIHAFLDYKVFRLAARIHELRQRGWNIETVMTEGPTGRKYAEYRLK